MRDCASVGWGYALVAAVCCSAGVRAAGVARSRTGLHLPTCLQVFPDFGVASYLKHNWQDTTFTLASLGDRLPLTGAEDLVVVAAPDPQAAEECVQLNRMVPAHVPMVLFNPRLVSGAPPLPPAVLRCIMASAPAARSHAATQAVGGHATTARGQQSQRGIVSTAWTRVQATLASA